jgi:hypothetical protein
VLSIDPQIAKVEQYRCHPIWQAQSKATTNNAAANWAMREKRNDHRRAVLNMLGNWQVNLYRHAAGEEITCVVAID